MKTILVPIDFSDATAPVLAQARLFARAFGSQLVLLKVAEPEPDFVGFEPGPQTFIIAALCDSHDSLSAGFLPSMRAAGV